ncbi:serine/threonine-protein kinase [Actinomadura verrucosospora]|uniref:serine/threonine-protein kinase n=1 Tax=Actinomadura verrucosospora TaxID=46165 RepID=UPI001563AE7D|nr:serine/threonine-protein kinase [Actinomadura verrucosospora]
MEPVRPEDPARIGGYPVLARIGAGGMGQVYLGVTGGARHIALKVIRDDFENPQALARFRREVATVERVRSRFAAAMVGAGLDAPPYWLATEYVPGPTLRQAVAMHGPLPPDTCLRLLSALAWGLLEIHRQGVQHRDLKPGNVILAPDGPRLIDFGIARGEDQTQITRTGAWNGTPGYVAPEVVREQSPVPASDVFSLAGTIAYAATGRPPFGGGRIEAIIHRTLSGDIDLDGADPRVAELVEACARKEPDERMPLERLAELAAAAGALAEDPAYRRLTGAPPALPLTVEQAAAAGLVPPDRARTPGLLGGRRRAAALAAGAGVVAVVLAGALAARYAFDGGGGGGPSATRSGGPAAAKTGGTPGTGAPAGSSPGAGGSTRSPGAGATGTGGPPDNVLVKQPTNDFGSLAWTKANSNCLPAIRPEDAGLATQMQTSAPRVPYTGKNVELGVRFKFAGPAHYYLAVQMRPPAGMGGNMITGVVNSRPRPYPGGDGWLYVHYPADFRWSGAGGEAFDLAKGDWTAIWLHVKPNGDAYYMGCDGFTVK